MGLPLLEPLPIHPAGDVYLWVEQESSIMCKVVTKFGDPVELTAQEARATALALLSLAEQLDPTPAPVPH